MVVEPRAKPRRAAGTIAQKGDLVEFRNSQAPRPKRVTSDLPLELRDDFVWGLAQGVEDVEPVFSGR